MSALADIFNEKLLLEALADQPGTVKYNSGKCATGGPFLKVSLRLLEELRLKEELSDFLMGSGLVPARVGDLMTMFDNRTLDDDAIKVFFIYLWNITPPFYEDMFEWLTEATLHRVMQINAEIILARYQAIKHQIPVPPEVIHSQSAREQIVDSMHINTELEGKARQRACENLFMRSFGMAFDTIDEAAPQDEANKQLSARLKLWNQSSMHATEPFDFRSQSVFIQLCTALTNEASVELRSMGYMLRNLKHHIFISEFANVLSFTPHEGLTLTVDDWPHVIRSMKAKGQTLLSMSVKTIPLFEEGTVVISDIPTLAKYEPTKGVLTEIIVYVYHLCINFKKYESLFTEIQKIFPIVFKEGIFGEIDLLLADTSIVMKNFMNTFVTMDRALRKTRDLIREEAELTKHALPEVYRSH